MLHRCDDYKEDTDKKMIQLQWYYNNDNN